MGKQEVLYWIDEELEDLANQAYNRNTGKHEYDSFNSTIVTTLSEVRDIVDKIG